MFAGCSMQTSSVGAGLQPAAHTQDGHVRYAIRCIHNATYEFAGKGLIDLVSSKTPTEIGAILASPDCVVTNSKDKELMLPVIRKLDDDVKSIMSTVSNQTIQITPDSICVEA